MVKCIKPLIADFCSSLSYLKLYDLGPVETKLVIFLPESSSVMLPSVSPACFDAFCAIVNVDNAIGIEI